MQVVLKKVMSVMPFLFGIGFIAPLIDQTLAAWGLAAPLGMDRLAFGLAVGGSWGLVANLRGRWL